MTPRLSQQRTRVVAVMEGSSVTGPAKNLFAFAEKVRSDSENPVDLSIVTYQRGAGSNAFIEGAQQRGIEVDVVREERAFQPSILPQLRAFVEQRRPAIVQTHNLKSHFLARLLRLGKNRPWIGFHHGYVATNAKVHVYNQLDRWSLPAADRVVTVCEPFAAHLRKIGVPPERIVVRHNMIRPFLQPDQSDVETLRRKLGIDPSEIVLFTAGRLSKEKGHLDLVEALALLRQNSAIPPFRMVIAGIGPERERLESRAQECGIGGRLLLVGLQAQVALFYALADVMVLPSHSEGSPNVLLEAMAAGVPSVVTAVGGVPEIAHDNENALMVERSNPKQLADAISRLMIDQALRERLSQAGLAVTARFTPDHYCQAMLNLYAAVLAERRTV